MSHSPIQVEVLLHYRYSPENWHKARGASPASDVAHDYWFRAGCLKSKVPTAGSGSVFELTDKGHAMVALWLRQPLPKVETVYLDGNHCPFCASSQLTGGAVEVEAGATYQEVVCDDCGNAWHDQYQLTGFAKIEED